MSEITVTVYVKDAVNEEIPQYTYVPESEYTEYAYDDSYDENTTSHTSGVSSPVSDKTEKPEKNVTLGKGRGGRYTSVRGITNRRGGFVAGRPSPAPSMCSTVSVAPSMCSTVSVVTPTNAQHPYTFYNSGAESIYSGVQGTRLLKFNTFTMTVGTFYDIF